MQVAEFKQRLQESKAFARALLHEYGAGVWTGADAPSAVVVDAGLDAVGGGVWTGADAPSAVVGDAGVGGLGGGGGGGGLPAASSTLTTLSQCRHLFETCLHTVNTLTTRRNGYGSVRALSGASHIISAATSAVAAVNALRDAVVQRKLQAVHLDAGVAESARVLSGAMPVSSPVTVQQLEEYTAAACGGEPGGAATVPKQQLPVQPRLRHDDKEEGMEDDSVPKSSGQRA